MNEKQATFAADLIQFMRPLGNAKAVETELPIESEPCYLDMLKHGCRLEAEVLATEEVSITVSKDDQDIDFSVTNNGPSVQQGIIDMLKRQCWLTIKQEKASR